MLGQGRLAELLPKTRDNHEDLHGNSDNKNGQERTDLRDIS